MSKQNTKHRIVRPWMLNPDVVLGGLVLSRTWARIFYQRPSIVNSFEVAFIDEDPFNNKNYIAKILIRFADRSCTSVTRLNEIYRFRHLNEGKEFIDSTLKSYGFILAEETKFSIMM